MIHPTATVSPNAHIGKDVSIGAFCWIEDGVTIGEGSVLENQVVIQKGVRIGTNVRIGIGTVISAKSQDLDFWENTSYNSEVVIGDDTHIQEYCVLKGDIMIGNKVWFASHVVVHHGARIGNGCKIFSGAVVSAISQDMKFKGEYTTLVIGDNTIIRECVTLNRGTRHNSTTRIGNNCLIMAYVHVAHDCIIGDNVILGNSVNMAGHVEIDDYATVSGMCAIHQFVRIGKHVMVSGGSLVGKDVPPYITAGRFPVQYEGLNRVGLHRRNFTSEQLQLLSDLYRILFCKGHTFGNAVQHILEQIEESPEKDEVLLFLANTEKRGIIKGI